MKRFWKGFALFSVVMMIALLSGDGNLVGQDTGPSENTEAAAAEKPQRSSKRLPPHYDGVVTTTQREAIYKVQSQYNSQIAELRLQIEDLIAERDQELDALLSKEQLSIVNQKREDSRAIRAARAEARRKAAEEAAASEATTGETAKAKNGTTEATE